MKNQQKLTPLANKASFLNSIKGVAKTEGGSAMKTCSGLHDCLENCTSAKLQERIKWLERVLGVDRREAHIAYKNEIYDLEEKLAIVESCLHKEMELKEVANKAVQLLKSKLKGVDEEKELVDKCLHIKPEVTIGI